ncbi:MAG: potassium transporter TrkG [Candidatus Marinimicrobia bacterium]|jgi:trk system potassium uptake protein TrkH|nr:potassium transporter TrkG [Candidatus Neomarinimicrobiota bacterium]MDP6611934.1 potassium transporter TrkG [Candidatus Neomarinimicrobiota bacterium]|tara:strand:- start:45864 stop:47333 length:1470 start_codon:yes stop_codon:yes gene_type:complete
MNFKTIFNILAAMLVLTGLFMIIPTLIAWGYGEPDLGGHLKSMALCVLVGSPLWIFTRKSRSLNSKDGFAIVTLAWILVALAGSLPFYLSGVIPNFTDAWFESMSGVTTTGASILGNVQTLPNLVNGIESLPHGVLFWRSFIQWIGGMGIIVFTIAILPLLGVGGVQLFKAEVPGPVADKIRPRVKETAKILWMVYVGLTVVETILLGISGMPWFDSICHALTTMPTGGFSTQNASIAAYGNPLIHYIIIIFMFIAGVNFTLHFRALSGNLKGYYKDPEFLTYLGITFGVTFFIYLNLASASSNWSHDNFLASMFQSVSILTTTGYGTTDYEIWPYFSQYLLLILMFIGGMGGSTGGGMKIARIILLLKYAATETRRMLHSRAIIPIRIGERYISEDVVRNTLGFFLFYMSIFMITTLILTTLNLDLSSSIGAAASAIGNIGPGLGAFGPTDNYALLHPIGKWMLTICMLLGRLEIFTIMVLFSRTFWK